MKLKKVKYLLLACVSLIVHIILPPTAPAQEQSEETFLSFGMNEINPLNKAVSRGEALKECLMDAVRQYTAKSVTPAMLKANHPILQKRIYENYNLFLRNYRIKSEKEEDGFFKVTAEVTLKSALLTEKLYELGMLQKTKEKPKLLILISDTENIDDKRSDVSWWTSGADIAPLSFSAHKILENRLSSMGFELTEKSRFLETLNEAKVSLKGRIIRGDIDTIRKFRFKDILISGSTYLSTASREGSPQTLSVSVSAYNLIDGRSLSQISKNYNLSQTRKNLEKDKKPDSLSDAITEALDSFAAELVPSFLTGWYASGVNTTLIEFKAVGVYSYKDYTALKDLLLRLKPEIVKVRDSLIQKGAYGFEIEAAGSAKSIAQKIENQSIEGKPIRIITVSRKRIVVGLK